MTNYRSKCTGSQRGNPACRGRLRPSSGTGKDARGTRFTIKNEGAPGDIDENKRHGQLVVRSVQGAGAAAQRAAVVPDRPRAPAKRCYGGLPGRTKPLRAETQRRGGNEDKERSVYFEPQRLCVSARDCLFFPRLQNKLH